MENRDVLDLLLRKDLFKLRNLFKCEKRNKYNFIFCYAYKLLLNNIFDSGILDSENEEFLSILRLVNYDRGISKTDMLNLGKIDQELTINLILLERYGYIYYLKSNVYYYFLTILGENILSILEDCISLKEDYNLLHEYDFIEDLSLSSIVDNIIHFDYTNLRILYKETNNDMLKSLLCDLFKFIPKDRTYLKRLFAREFLSFISICPRSVKDINSKFVGINVNYYLRQLRDRNLIKLKDKRFYKHLYVLTKVGEKSLLYINSNYHL